MPELPEVEITCKGIAPFLIGSKITSVIVRDARLRKPIPSTFFNNCQNKIIKNIFRRGKYILLELNKGHILIHLGMSGHLSIANEHTPLKKHDHIDLITDKGSILRYRDPRRFGLCLYIDTQPLQHPLLHHLGVEPLSEDFTAHYLQSKGKNRKVCIKSFIMNATIVVGVGNIYATESLYLAHINPKRPTHSLLLSELELLVFAIKKTLHQAISMGGTSLKDFLNPNGNPGYFAQKLYVYGRKGELCFHCKTLICDIRISNRASAFCPQCQPIESNCDIISVLISLNPVFLSLIVFYENQ